MSKSVEKVIIVLRAIIATMSNKWRKETDRQTDGRMDREEQMTQIKSRRQQQKNWWERKWCRGVKLLNPFLFFFSLSLQTVNHFIPACCLRCLCKVQISSLQSEPSKERQRGVGKTRSDDKKWGRRKRWREELCESKFTFFDMFVSHEPLLSDRAQSIFKLWQGRPRHWKQHTWQTVYTLIINAHLRVNYIVKGAVCCYKQYCKKLKTVISKL